MVLLWNGERERGNKEMERPQTELSSFRYIDQLPSLSFVNDAREGTIYSVSVQTAVTRSGQRDRRAARVTD